MEYLKKYPEFIEEAIKLGNLKIKRYNKILVCGMGASGLPGYILRNLLDKPVFTSQSYNIPNFVDKKTLVFIISYSGNTEETISMYKQAKQKTKRIIIIASAGTLAKEKNVIKVPKGLEPRHALPYLFFTAWSVLGNKDVKNLTTLLKKFNKNKPKNLAIKIYKSKKIPAIYTSSGYGSIALKFKQNIHEDSKLLAIANVLPEMNHNEIESDFSKAYPLIIRDKKESGRMKKRLNLTTKLIKADNIYLEGSTKLEKIFYGIYFAEHLSNYLAKLYKKSPTKYIRIQKLKRLMKA